MIALRRRPASSLPRSVCRHGFAKDKRYDKKHSEHVERLSLSSSLTMPRVLCNITDNRYYVNYVVTDKVGTATLTRGHNYVVSRSFTFPLGWVGPPCGLGSV